MKSKAIIWYLTIFYIILIFVLAIVELLLGKSILKVAYVRIFVLALPIIANYWHASIFLGLRRGIGFIALSAFIGLGAEILGVNYGIGFGGKYSYPPQPSVFNVPVIIPIYWSIFIYISYALSTSILGWLGINKPTVKNFSGLIIILLLSILDGFLTMNVDMGLDPMQVARGSWEWLDAGPYFGIPIGNFIGWFFVGAISSLIFRLFEGFSPKKILDLNDPFMIHPTISYGIVCVSIILISLQINHPEYSLIAASTMVPIILANLLIFLNSQVYKS